jgi:PAS domain S-box-containing protein
VTRRSASAPARRDVAPRAHLHEPVPLGALLEEAADGVLLLDDSARRVLAANAALCALVGRPRAAVLAGTWAELLDPADAAARPPAAAEARAGSGDVIDRRLRRADGEGVPVEACVTRLDDGRRLLVLRALGPRAAAAAALRESERELRALFAAMRDVVVVLDRGGRYVRVVPTGRELLLRPPEDLVGRTLHEVMPADDADRFAAVIDRVLAQRRAEEVAYTLALPQRTAQFRATVSPLDAHTVSGWRAT